MVLDGAVDPTLTSEELSLGQARGFQIALDAYLEYCIKEGDCVVGDTVEEGARRIRGLLDELDAEPLPTVQRPRAHRGAREVRHHPAALRQGLLAAAHHRRCRQAIEDGRGDRLLALSDQYTSRGPDGYIDNSMAALNAVNCLDYSDCVPVEQIPSPRRRSSRRPHPTFGRLFVYSLSTCDSWPVKSTKDPEPLHAAGAPPIVVIGTTRDPATPYEWAKSLASQLDSGRLITRDGDGHTGFHQGNSASTTRSSATWSGGNVADGRTCPAERRRPPVLATRTLCPAPAPILVRRARLTGRALRRLSSVGRASHS